jgi:hypothetical protein
MPEQGAKESEKEPEGDFLEVVAIVRQELG